MSDSQLPPKSFSPDDALPPIEPPSAGFLVQLFLIPGIIVAIIVVVWLLFHWLAQMGNDPREYIKKLRGNSEVRWQAAVNLAAALHGAAGDDIKNDPAVAADLGKILQAEITDATTDEPSIKMRTYLCRALGEFHVDTGLSALLTAAKTQHTDDDLAVRLAAIEGLASLAANLQAEKKPWNDADVVATLIDAANSDNNTLRAESAFALGVLDNPQALARLEPMLDDTYPDARFNAATGLARHGKESALPVLLEMLDPEQTLATQEEAAQNRTEKRKIVNVNGLHALYLLATANPNADFSKALPAVEKLVHSDLPEVRDSALAVKEKLSRREHSAAEVEKQSK